MSQLSSHYPFLTALEEVKDGGGVLSNAVLNVDLARLIPGGCQHHVREHSIFLEILPLLTVQVVFTCAAAAKEQERRPCLCGGKKIGELD